MTLLLPTSINGCETWFLTQLDGKKLSVFENNCLRANLNIRLQDHVSIDKTRKSAKQQNSTENIIQKGRLTCFGYVGRLNGESLVRNIIYQRFKLSN